MWTLHLLAKVSQNVCFVPLMPDARYVRTL